MDSKRNAEQLGNLLDMAQKNCILSEDKKEIEATQLLKIEVDRLRAENERYKREIEAMRNDKGYPCATVLERELSEENNALKAENAKLRELVGLAIEQLRGQCQYCGSDGIIKDDEPVMCKYNCKHLDHRFVCGWNDKPKSHKHCKGKWQWQHASKLKEIKEV